MKDPNFEEQWNAGSLLIKKLNGTLTAEEQQKLDSWLHADPANHAVLDRLLNKDAMADDMDLINSFDTEEMLFKMRDRIDKENKEKSKPIRTLYYKSIMAVAAAAAVLVMFFLLYNFNGGEKRRQLARIQTNNETTPADNNHLYLTLADGSKIDLDSVNKGVVSHQGNTTITKSDNGQLDYTADNNAKGGNEIVYNAITIPKGKKFEMILPDGSKVWLNASTSLKFPVTFKENEREVELDGEAYFEVAHNPQWPFKVKTKDQTVEVLGTHFNVEAYNDDTKTITALVEGKVRVHKGDLIADIKPGQMTVNDAVASKIITKNADLESLLAWRKGLFYFKDERIDDIMKKVARAYDVEVQYRGDIKDKRFWITYPIEHGLDNLLKTLEQTNTIHFEKQQRKIIVTP